jgi:signal transduction histidine kinase
VDINRCLHTVVYIASSVIPSRVRVVEEYGALPQVLCSPSQLNQVFLNLVSNAAQAIEGSGTVKVRTAVQGERIRIDVEDSGSGIAPHVLPHIFETYYTTKPEGVGTGLGLSIARDIARAHGGDIEVVTERGRGSTFTVWLPLQHAPELGLAA